MQNPLFASIGVRRKRRIAVLMFMLVVGIVLATGYVPGVTAAPATPQVAPVNCSLTRTPAPAFIYDPAINANASLYSGTVAVTTERGTGISPLHIINLAAQDGVVVNGQTWPQVGQPWVDPAPERFEPTTAPLSWNTLGSVLGTTLDTWGNIYLASTSSFNSVNTPGRIFKIDTLTGRISTFVSNVPGDSSGGTSNASLGDITSNIYLNNDIFVASMDTGLIYRYGSDGTLKSTYDHGVAGRVAAGMEQIPNIGTFGNNSATIKGRRVWAVEVYNTATGPRLFYSVVWRYNGQAPQSGDYTNAPYNIYGININDEDTNNQVWSVGLNATTGDFVPSTARREFSTVLNGGLWINNGQESQDASKWPISDITFVASTGALIAATRGAQDNGLNDMVSHEGQVFVATPVGSTWSLSANAFDGFGVVGTRNDGSGGVAWDPTALNGGGRVWITAEALQEGPYDGPGPLGNLQYNVFGLIGMPQAGATNNSGRASGLLLDVNGNYNQEKQTGGDVEIGCIPQFDYGDLPAAMANTLLANNGARHLIRFTTNGTPASDQIYLGALLDAESNGQPSTLANGDNTNGVNDEDGIVAPVALWNTITGGQVTATVAGSGWLVGWADWNNDGVFTDNEMLFSRAVVNGGNLITFPLTTATIPQTGLRARFRLFTSQSAAQAVGVAMGGTNEAAADIGPAQNGEVEDYLFGTSLGVELESFEALCQPDPTAVVASWRTASETNTLGFHLYRSTTADGERTRLNTTLIPAQATGGGGADYAWTDDTATNGTYYYWLEDVDTLGGTAMHGPATASAPCEATAITLDGFGAARNGAGWGGWLVAGVLLAAGMVVGLRHRV